MKQAPAADIKETRMPFVNDKQPYTAMLYPKITVSILTLAHTFGLTYNKMNALQLWVTKICIN